MPRKGPTGAEAGRKSRAERERPNLEGRQPKPGEPTQRAWCPALPQRQSDPGDRTMRG